MKILAISLPLALIAAAAQAAPQADARCTTLPENVRAAIGTADAGTAQAARRHLATGEKLCEARNRRAAADQFRAAARLLGLDEEGRAPVRQAAANP